MTQHPTIEDWKEEFHPIKTEEVAEAVSEDSSWNSSQTGMGRLHEMEILDKLTRLSNLDKIVEVGSNEGLTLLNSH